MADPFDLGLKGPFVLRTQSRHKLNTMQQTPIQPAKIPITTIFDICSGAEEISVNIIIENR